MQTIEESPRMASGGPRLTAEVPPSDHGSRGMDALESMGQNRMGAEAPLCNEHLDLELVWCGSAEATEADVRTARRICANCPALRGCDARARFNPFTPYFLAGTNREERLASLSRRDRTEFRRRGVVVLHQLGLGVAEIAAVLSDWMGPTSRCGRRTVEQDIADLGLVGRRRRHA